MSNKRHPFNFEQEEWPKEENDINVLGMELIIGSSSTSTVSYTVKMRIIDGSESPELWCKFLESLDQHVLENDYNCFPKFQNKIDIIKHLTKGEARRIVDETLLSALDPTENTRYDYECWLTEFSHDKNLMDQEDWNSYTKTEEYKNDIILEIIFKLRSYIFGTIPTLGIGCNLLQKHRIWLRSLRFDPTIHGSIRTFSSRCLRLNHYSRFCPTRHTEKRGEEPRPLNDEELVELLDVQLSDAKEYLKILPKNGWDLYRHTYEENITRLEEIESSALTEIEREREMQRHIDDLYALSVPRNHKRPKKENDIK